MILYQMKKVYDFLSLTYLFIFTGCGDGDIDASEKIVNEMLVRYPEVENIDFCFPFNI